VEGFVSAFGRAFYARAFPGVGGDWNRGKTVVLRRVDGEGRKVDERWVMGEESVVPFWAGKALRWEIVEGV
jgi:dihydroorotase